MSEKNVYEVEKILEISNSGGNLQWKVRWKNYSPADDTWEPISNLSGCIHAVEKFCDAEFHKKRNDFADNLEQYNSKMLPLYKERILEQKKENAKTKTNEIIQITSKLPFQDELFPKVEEKQQLNITDQSEFSLSENDTPNFHDRRKRYDQFNSDLLFLKPYNILQTVINRCPPRLLQNECEPLCIKSIRKSETYYDALTVFSDDDGNPKVDLWVPLEVAKHLYPQLVITYLLERWEANNT